MRTLPRNGSAKQITGSQVSDTSGDGLGFPWIARRKFLHRFRAGGWGYPLACCLALLLACCLVTARAADPQSYKVEMASTGNGDMNATL